VLVHSRVPSGKVTAFDAKTVAGLPSRPIFISLHVAKKSLGLADLA
jgi:hypothetical protein